MCNIAKPIKNRFRVSMQSIADLILHAFGVHLSTCNLLYGYLFLSKTSGSKMKPAGSKVYTNWDHARSGVNVSPRTFTLALK